MINKNKIDDDSILPYVGYKFMSINTFNDINKISISNGKWYDIDTENKHYDYNYNHYFKFDTLINFEKNRLNNKTGALGANIYNNELRGPSCYNFANNSETYELVEFTMFITANFIACSKTNNIIFEMTGNTTTSNKIIPEYTTSIININIIVNNNKNYDFHLTIGDIIYKGEANNIDKALLEDSDYLIIGLFYTKEKVGLILNSKIYEYVNINNFPITLGSTPLLINKYGSINMHLYNFIYYKNLFDFNNYEYLVRYDNYYISGLNSSTCKKPEITTISRDPIKYQPIKYNKILLPMFKYPILDDEKYKYNILPISYGLNTILQLNPVNFQWIKGEENDLGFIAQDVAEIIPEAVNTNWNSDLLMRYESIIPILTKAIQEQNALIKSLEQRILILENK
jgi:hypothetical protein